MHLYSTRTLCVHIVQYARFGTDDADKSRDPLAFRSRLARVTSTMNWPYRMTFRMTYVLGDNV